MNVNIYILSDNILMGKKTCPNFIEQKAVIKGFFVTSKYILPSYYPELKTLLEKHEKELNIIVCEKNKARVNESLAQLTGDILRENTHLKKAVMEYYKSINMPAEKQSSAEWEIPSKSRGIVNENSLYQGYFIKSQKGSYVVLSLDNYKNMFELVIDEVEDNEYKTITFKTFGLLEENIRDLLHDFYRNKDGIKISTFHDELDVDIIIKAKENNEKFEEYSSAIMKKLSKFIYAEENISIYNVAFDLLTITNKTLAIAESVTGGNIASNIIKNNKGASKIISNSFITYSDEAKHTILGVSKQTLKDKSAVSSEVAYEMVQGLVNVTNADFTIATTGYADSDNIGECFIAIGDRETIHVYKNIFSGSRETIIENITKAALFYLIKKIRSNDFIFN